jgi:ferric-dicitrate binding protein FerR (iron transport regulator)
MYQNGQNIDEHLLLQYLLGNADAESCGHIEEWLNADSRNRNHLDRLESLWLETGKLSPNPVAVDVDAAWQRMDKRISQQKTADLNSHSAAKSLWSRPGRVLFRAAAVVILLAGIYGIFKLINKPAPIIEMASSMAVVHDTLPDGSKVALNLNSKLTFPEKFIQGSRVVNLTGEAFFDVRHDTQSPFVVHTGDIGVKVLGTSFGIKSTGGVVEVSVAEGRVLLYKTDKRTGDTSSVVLSAGQNGKCEPGAGKPFVTETDSPDLNFWANQSLDFRSTELSKVFALLEKYYSVKITVSDPAVLDCRLTATFMNDPPDKILTIICESFSLKLKPEGQKFYLTGHGCGK